MINCEDCDGEGEIGCGACMALGGERDPNTAAWGVPWTCHKCKGRGQTPCETCEGIGEIEHDEDEEDWE